MSMKHPKGKISVIDDYFPSWLVNQVSMELECMPVRYTNSPYANFDKARFFGAMLMEHDQYKDIPPWWFIEYFNQCMYNDVAKLWTVGHCYRVLLNGQLQGQSGCLHSDADSDNYLTVIYMGHGNSGDTVFENGKRVEFKLGRLVIFNSSDIHKGDAPNDGYRVSLGAVYPSVPLDKLD